MKLTTVSKLALAIGLSCLLPVNAHLRRTKGLKNKAKHKRNLQYNQKGIKGGAKTKLSDLRDKYVVVSATPTDREEAAFANNEFGETLYVPATVPLNGNEEGEGFWKFADPNDEDREDGDLGPSDFVVEVGQDEKEGTEEPEETDNENEDTTDLATVYSDFLAKGDELSDAELEAFASEISKNTPQLEGVFIHENPDMEEDLQKQRQSESDLIVGDGPDLGWTSDNGKLVARITEAEIQLDSLLQLSDKVVDMQAQLDRALAVIEEQKQAIATLATMMQSAADATASDTDP